MSSPGTAYSPEYRFGFFGTPKHIDETEATFYAQAKLLSKPVTREVNTMANIHSFRALTPTPGKESLVASVPYDVVSRAQASRIGGENPESFMHVIRPEIGLAESTDEHDSSVYEAGRAALEGFIDGGLLGIADTPGLYIYRLDENGWTQTGVVACCDVDAYRSDSIRKHELTRPDKEDDRVRHIESLSCHTGPVLMTYRRNEVISGLVEKITAGDPTFSFIADDGIRHTGWRVPQGGDLEAAFTPVDALYIADGHHRAAAATRVATQSDDPETAHFLTVLFPHNELRILAYNRHIRMSSEERERVLAEIGNAFTRYDCPEGVPAAGSVCMYIGDRWCAFDLPSAEETASPAARLDLSRFTRYVLEPVLGITDQRTDKRITFVGGHDSVAELAGRVDSEGGIAFSFHPVTVDQLLDVSDAGELMPPKSTWFSPKLRSGLFSHPFGRLLKQ